MTTIVKILISIVLALFVSSCVFNGNFSNGKKGNGLVIEDTRETPEEFTEVSAAEGLEVYITQSNKTSILVKADENIIDLINTDIKNGKLYIHTSENIGSATKKIHISLPIITQLKSSSGANLIAENTIEADNIELNASSGANVKLDVTANKVSITTSSGANIRVSGNTSYLATNASSGAQIKANKLITKTCNAKASSGSGITVNVLDILNANASSGGNISYTGQPQVEKTKSVSGSITKG